MTLRSQQASYDKTTTNLHERFTIEPALVGYDENHGRSG
jgi:hypothetical protein